MSTSGSSPFDPENESITAANRLNRALGLPEKSRDASGRRQRAPAADSASAPPAPATAPPAATTAGSGVVTGQPAPPSEAKPGFIGRLTKPAGPGTVITGDATRDAADRPALPQDHLAEGESALRPASRALRRSSPRRVKRSRRTIRHIDPWSVFKVSVLLYICLYLAVMLAGVLLWSALQRSGLVESFEDFIAEVGSYSVWEIDGNVIYQRARIIGLVLAAAGVAFNVVLALIFNLISDLVGGIRMTILEEDNSSPDA